MNLSFKFVDEKLNQRFISKLKSSGIKFKLNAENVVQYHEQDDERIENEFIAKFRDQVFPEWQILACPAEDAWSYKAYMLGHKVPFLEELIDQELCFVLPRSYRPHTWKLEAYRKAS